MKSIFDSKSVAVIGASRDRNKVGHAVLVNLKKSFGGRIFPVNPKARSVLGMKCYPGILDIKRNIDLAVVAIPSRLVPEVMEECGKANVRNVIVISAGFKETGMEGAKLERECLRIARKHGMRMLGPNCLGVIDTETEMNVSFASQKPLRGKIAFLSQSGALCTAILDWAGRKGVGFSKFISLGNKADLNENDFLRYFYTDRDTNVVSGYLEDLSSGREFMSSARRLSKRKPIVMLKAGRTEKGARAVASHTGALAGSDAGYDAAFRQSGVIRADSVGELFDYSMALTYQPIPKGEKIAIITNAGGPGIMATDSVERNGMRLASFSRRTIDYLKKNLPANANIYNPVDVIGDAREDRYRTALDAVLKDKNVNGVIVLVTPQAMTDTLKIAKVVSEASKKCKKPVLCSFMGGDGVSKGVEFLRSNSIPNYEFPENAAGSMKAMVRYGEIRKFRHMSPPKIKVDGKAAGRVLRVARKEGQINLGLESLKILESYGISTAESKVARTLKDAIVAADGIGYPVAMKVVSQDIMHKSDVGGIMLNVRRDGIESAHAKLMANVSKFMPSAKITGVLVQKMITGGKEVIIGVKKDPKIGHLVMFGLGGIYVEVLKDVSFRVAPINEDEARNMISEIKGYSLLRGVRGEKPLDVKSVEDTLLRVSKLVTDFPQIVELDVNPLMVFESGGGCVALDARTVLEGKR